jgi:uncharacterized protein YutD
MQDLEQKQEKLNEITREQNFLKIKLMRLQRNIIYSSVCTNELDELKQRYIDILEKRDHLIADIMMHELVFAGQELDRWK